MLQDKQICLKKDKRMLVLLSFGCLIILFRLLAIYQPHDLSGAIWAWHEEIRNDGVQLHRNLIEPAFQYNRASLIEKGRTPIIESDLSARASFLLGAPFPINKAGIEEMVMLPGVGPKLAANIIQYRKEHGGITDSDTLMKVPGIGRKMAAKTAPLLKFQEK